MNTKTTITTALALSLCAAFLVGCPHCDEDGPPPSAAAYTLCNEYHDALDSWSDRCAPRFETRTGYRAEEERFRFATLCSKNLTAPGTTGIDWLRACVDKARNGSCEENIFDCTPPPGTLANGAGCVEDGQCASGLCNLDWRRACGTCAPRVLIGGACTGDNLRECVDGAVCGMEAKRCLRAEVGEEGMRCGEVDAARVVRCKAGLLCREICMRPSESGEVCELPSDCASGFMCDASTKTCAKRPIKGEACSTLYDCGENTLCDLATKKCTPIVTAQETNPCDSHHRCSEQLVCVGNELYLGNADGTAEKPGTCAQPLPDGAPCAAPITGNERPCDVYASCIEGKCTMRDPMTCR